MCDNNVCSRTLTLRVLFVPLRQVGVVDVCLYVNVHGFQAWR